MTSSHENTLNKVRNSLRVRNIKLWLPPYTNNDGGNSEEAKALLATGISKDLNIEADAVSLCLEELRHHAVERLRQNENFKNNKIAILKIKCSGRRTDAASEFEVVETRLDVTGAELKKLVVERLRTTDDLKLICNGHVITEDLVLENQNIKHNSVILCLMLTQSDRAESSEVEKALKAVKRARQGAELLATIGDETRRSQRTYDVQIADQKGQSLDLPDEEKRSLTVALGLHEKGRAMLKRKQYEIALLLLLEADKEFKECRAEILNMVDNFAVLCLDIVWCYVCTKNISALPDARSRLDDCEAAFKKSYGDSLQRLLAIKGNSGNEISLFVRLYLLQGIVFYHEGKFAECMELFDKAKGYAKTVVTDQDKVTEMMGLGFSGREARRALRANMMDVAMATQWAFHQREEHKEIKKREGEKKRIKKLQKSLGPCANGDPVNADMYDQLVLQMGFEPTLAAESLKKSNNNVVRAVELIDKEPDQLRDSAKKVKLNGIQELKNMGFNEGVARACLDHFGGLIEEAASYLAEHLGQIPDEWKSGFEQFSASTSSQSSKKLTEEEEELLRDVAGDVTEHKDEYLDITLDEEMQLIAQYMTMVASVTDR